MKQFIPIRFRSIRMTFVVPFAVAIFMIVTVLAVTLISGAKNVSTETLTILSNQLLGQVYDDLDTRFNEAMKINQFHAVAYQQGLLNVTDERTREQFFSGDIRPYTEVAMTYVGFPDGRFYGARRTIDNTIQVVRSDSETDGLSTYYSIDDMGVAISMIESYEGFDVLQRPWYQLGVASGEPAFTEIYNHFVFNQPTISAVYPLYSGDALEAVFGVDYLLTWMGEELAELPVKQDGIVYIVDHTGKMIASSRKSESIFLLESGVATQLNATESPNRLITQSVDIEKTQALEENPWTEIDGGRYYVAEMPFQVKGLDWRIYVLLAESDFMGSMFAAVHRSLVGLAVSMMVLFIMTLIISRYLTQPILRLNHAAGKLARGEFTYVPDEMRRDELGALTRSFNSMAIDLTNAVTSLEKTVERRTAELKESNERLNGLSFSDGLTGLANRRRFDDFFSEVYQFNYSHKRSMGLLIIDIDDFKMYNDTYGHLAGDDCLKKVADCFKDVFVHSKDLAVRYGGEEFAIILQGRSRQEVLETAESLRKSIYALDMRHESSPENRVTISVGAAYFMPDALDNQDVWLRRADLALYSAKSSGKNCVRVFEKTMEEPR